MLKAMVEPRHVLMQNQEYETQVNHAEVVRGYMSPVPETRP